VTGGTDSTRAVGERAPAGRQVGPEPPAPRVHLPPARRHPPPPAPPVWRRWDVGSPVVDAAALATLRANLHELAAEIHELAASIDEVKAELHGRPRHDPSGDALRHTRQANRRRAAAAAERASAQKERHAAEQARGQR
jgi:hypothetical protein